MNSVVFIKTKFLILARRSSYEWYLSALGIFVVVVLLWLPFGLKTTDIADGWINLPQVERNSFVSSFYSSRPLVYLPWEIAVHISKDSYIGVNFVLAALFWGKAVVLYMLLRKLRLVLPSIAFLISILFILYPADSGNFLMRALGRHAGVFFFFLALLLLVLSSQRSNIVYFFSMVVAEAISALIAEQGFLPMLVAPAILFLTETFPKKRRIVILTWYITLFLAVINFVIAPKGHQQKILDIALSGEYIKEIILSNLVAYQRIFVDGWWKAIQKITNPQWEYLFFAFMITVAAGMTVYLLDRFARDYQAETNTSRHFTKMIIASIIIIGLSFFPYSLTNFRYETSRVFYYAAAGGALTTGLIYFRLGQMPSRFIKWLYVGVWSVTIFLVSFNGLVQHSRMEKNSQVQQRILIGIVEQAPSVKPNTIIVLVSGKRRPFTKLDSVFRSALSWLYEDPKIQAMACSNLQDCLSKNLQLDRSILFKYTENRKLILLEELAVEDKIANRYRPYNRIKDYVPFPERAQKAFDIKPDPKRLAPRSWMEQGQTLNDRRVCNASHSGNCSLLFYGAGALTTFSQKIAISGQANEQIELSFWTKSGGRIDPVPIANLKVLYDDGSEDVLTVSGQLTESWAMQQLSFKTNKPYSGLVLELLPDSTSSLIWVDDVQLTKDTVELLVKNPSFEK